MTLSSNRARRGALGNSIAVIASVLLASTALVISVSREPLQPGFALRNPLGDPLEGYQFDSPGGAAKSLMRMEINRDFRARLEYESRMDTHALKEQYNTFKIEKEVSFQREQSDKKQARERTGEFAILFVTYELKGELCKEVITMEKDHSGIWTRRYLGTYEVRPTNKELSDEMEAWESKARAVK